MPGAMLDCAICSTRKWKNLEAEHQEDLRMAGAARLFCENCTRETYWIYSQHSGGAAPMRRAAEPPARVGEEAVVANSGAASAAGDATASPAMPGRVMQTERRILPDRRQRTRRAQRRVALQVPVRLRVISAAAQFEEITRTINVCRNGIYIHSERPYTNGAPIYVAMNYSAREPGMAPEQRATVVRVETLAGSSLRGVAIQMH